MFLLNEPAWRYFLFVSFVSLYSLYRMGITVFDYRRERWQRIRRAAEKALKEHYKNGTHFDASFEVVMPPLSVQKRLKIVAELAMGLLVFGFSAVWGIKLFQTSFHTHQGIMAAGLRDEARAMQEFDQALKSNPIAGKLHYAYYALDTEEDRQDVELIKVRALTRRHPNDAKVFANLGKVYLKLTRYKEAVGAFRQAVILNPNSGDLHVLLGDALCQGQQIDKAIDQYQIAIVTDPHYGPFHNSLANVYFFREEWDKAAEEYNTALYYNPSLIQPYWRLSEIFVHQGRRSEAIEQLQRLLKKSHMPEDAAIIQQLRASIADIRSGK